MISKKVVKFFLDKPTTNWSVIKDVTDHQEYADEIEELTHFKFKTKCFKHQLACFLLGYYNSSFLFFLDMGLGKTKSCLDLLSYYKAEKFINKILVLMPNVVMTGVWMDEIKKHSNLSYVALIGTKQEREKALKKDVDLYLMNYAGLQVTMTDYIDRKRILSETKILKFTEKFDAVIFDEIHTLANRKSIQSQLSLRIAKRCKVKYGLTGTPFNRDLMNLWHLFYLIDGGDTLGYNITMYRDMFFDCIRNYWGGYEYKLKKDTEKKLFHRLQNKSIRYSEKECLDLPVITYIQTPLKFPQENLEYYKKGVENVIESKGNYRALENAFIRLRQIASGFVGFKNDEEDRVQIIFDNNPKLDALIELIDEIEGKIVIFNEFTLSGDFICERLKKEKIKYVRLYGKTKDKVDVVKRFQGNKKLKVFVVNSKSGGVGLNLQTSNYCIFYESPVSCIVRSQAEKRIHRIGQKKRVFIYDLFMKYSIEEKILKYLKEGKNLFNVIIEGKEKLF